MYVLFGERVSALVEINEILHYSLKLFLLHILTNLERNI